MIEHRDCLGVYIEVGDTIVYPVRRGSNLHMKAGKVLELTKITHKDFADMVYPALRIATTIRSKDPTKISVPRKVEVTFQRFERCVVAKGEIDV